MNIKGLFDPATSTLTYVVSDPGTGDAVVIDPVLDYDAASSATSYDSLQKVTQYIVDENLTLRMILETHAHADHLSGSQALKARFADATIAVSERITQVQATFREVFGLPDGFPVDGRQFDRLLKDEEIVEAGSLRIGVIPTPGHTPACTTFHIGDALFTGDTMFMPDSGTGRCDFPAGSADGLYESITERIYSFPDATRIFVGHDYQPGGRELKFETTVGAQKEGNIQLPGDRSREDFVEFREKRDAGLNAPKLLFQSVQVNIDGGKLPPADDGRQFLRVPINAFRPAGDAAIELGQIK
jgi:glyoxylase-like metal-dependent hydrolase (beta-lactamase superfamily II)